MNDSFIGMVLEIGIFIIIGTWIVLRYYKNTKGVYRRTFRGFFSEIKNFNSKYPDADTNYPVKDKITKDKRENVQSASNDKEDKVNQRTNDLYKAGLISNVEYQKMKNQEK